MKFLMFAVGDFENDPLLKGTSPFRRAHCSNDDTDLAM